MSKYHIPLLPDTTYHVFNRAVGNEKLFKTVGNYNYFLTKMTQHVLPVCDLFTYSLMPNHFHLLIRIKNEEIITSYFELKKKRKFDSKLHSLPDFIMEQFSNWLNGYTKAFNKMYNRKGALFIDYLKRSSAEKDTDFTSFIFYVHKNTVHHGITQKIGEWKYDGYQALLSEKPTLLLRKEVIDWFGSKEQFVKFHDRPIVLKKMDAFNY